MSRTILKFCDGRLRPVPYECHNLGYVFWTVDDKREAASRERYYGPIGSGWRARDIAFRRKYAPGTLLSEEKAN